jgi:hypothetical protein
MHEMTAASEAAQKRLEDRRWLVRIVLAVAIAGASSAALSLMGFKGKPVLVGGGWVTNDFSDPCQCNSNGLNFLNWCFIVSVI